MVRVTVQCILLPHFSGSLKSYQITDHAIILSETFDKTAAKIEKRKGESMNTQHPQLE